VQKQSAALARIDKGKKNDTALPQGFGAKKATNHSMQQRTIQHLGFVYSPANIAAMSRYFTAGHISFADQDKRILKN